VRSAVFVLHRDPDQPHRDFVAAVRAARPSTPCVVNVAHETNALWAEHVGIEARPSRVAATVIQPADVRALDAALATLAVRHDGYLAESVVQWDHLEGEETADVGVKQVALVGRLDDLDRAEFRRRYDGQHGPLARIQHPGVWRYTQRFVVEDLTPDAPPVDAFAELHFRTVADFQRRFYLNATAPDVVAEDTAEFLERRRTFTVMVDEIRSA
jgi:uncharacterized protein (TIGR02118 family)